MPCCLLVLLDFVAIVTHPVLKFQLSVYRYFMLLSSLLRPPFSCFNYILLVAEHLSVRHFESCTHSELCVYIYRYKKQLQKLQK